MPGPENIPDANEPQPTDATAFGQTWGWDGIHQSKEGDYDASDVLGLTVVAMLVSGCVKTVTVNMHLKPLQAIEHGIEFSPQFFAKTLVCVL